MSKLKLTLTAIDNKCFTIVAENYATENSILPFFDNQEKSHLRTVINALNDLTGQYSSNDDSNNDLEWMIAEGILDKNNRQMFHPKMRENIGKKLYQALFPEAIKKALNGKFGSLGSNENLHIQIEYDFKTSSNSNLSLYPWNLVHDGNEFLAKTKVIFSYRILDGKLLAQEKRQIDKLKVLVISSQASETDESKLQHQESLINDSLKKAQDEGRACLLSWYEPQKERPTFKVLRNYLTDNYQSIDKLPDIIHFNGHGVFKDNSGFLLFEDESSRPNYISAEDFADLIDICNPKPQLIVITACQAALAHKSNSVFNGVAQKLLQQVPAVVATPFSISQDSATDFIDQFYRVLGNGKSSLLEAVRFASKAMKYKQYEWYRLILFLRHDVDEDGYLFEFLENKETSALSSSPENKQLDSSDMDRLKKILINSKLLSPYRRVNLLLKIGVNTNFVDKNIDNYTDEDFAYTLIDFLENTQQIEILCKLCQEIESKITTGIYQAQLQTIKFKLC